MSTYAHLSLPRIFANTFLLPAQDYFAELNKDAKQGRIGTIRKVELMYGPPPASAPLGKVEVSFQQADAAHKAVDRLKDLKIDNKPIHVSILLPYSPLLFGTMTLTPIKLRVLISGDAVPEPPSLSARITNAPRSAASAKAGGKNAKNGAAPAKAAAGAGKKGRGGKAKSARPAKKTEDELDAEMADYFDPAKDSNNAAPATNGGDAQMDDEIL